MENIEEQTTKITVKNFLNWLDGVRDMQEEDWVPDAKQWNKILTKIYEIDDAEEPARPALSYSSAPQYPTYRATLHQAPEAINPPPTGPITVAGPSPLSGVNPMLNPTSTMSGPIASGHHQTPVKTPNIDGNYDTPFV